MLIFTFLIPCNPICIIKQMSGPHQKTYQISAPIPCCGHPSSTVTSLLVFLTEALIVALSRGLIDRRFISCRKHINLKQLKKPKLACFTHSKYFLWRLGPSQWHYDVPELLSVDVANPLVIHFNVLDERFSLRHMLCVLPSWRKEWTNPWDFQWKNGGCWTKLCALLHCIFNKHFLLL